MQIPVKFQTCFRNSTLFQTLDSTMPTAPPLDLRVQPYLFFKTHFSGSSLERSAKSPPSVPQLESISLYSFGIQVPVGNSHPSELIHWGGSKSPRESLH